jgi:imidazolonepropionase-like amidohydrolase
MIRIIASLVGIMSCGVGFAQNLVITNARIIDGTGVTIERGSVVVDRGQIASVSAGEADAPGVRIDAQQMTVMPGMIDTHVHLLLVDRQLENQQALDNWIDQVLPGDLRAYLESGVTTIFSNGDYTDPILAVKRAIENRELQGPRLLVVGPVFTAPGGHPATTVCGGMPSLCRDLLAVEVSDVETARGEVRRLASLGVDGIKAVYESTLGEAILRDDVLEAIGEEAERYGLPLIVHAPGELGLRAVELGADKLVHPPLRDGVDLTEASRLLRSRSIPFATTTHGQAHPQVPDGEEQLARYYLPGIRRLWDDGVTIAFGTDRFFASPSEDIRHEIEILSRVLTPEEVIVALTRNAAAYLDLSDEIGTLEPGKIGDMVIIRGDPLADLSNLANVMVVIQGGQVVVDNR